MLVVLQAVVFAGCVLIDLLPGTEVDCHMGVPLATWSAPAPGTNAPAECPAAPPAVTPAEQCTETAG